MKFPFFKKKSKTPKEAVLTETEKIYQKGITYPRYLQTSWFTPIINLDVAFDIGMFIHPMESGVVLKNLAKTVTQIQSQINMEEEAGKIRDPILETALNDAERLRDDLQQGIERFFQFGLYITVWGDSEEETKRVSSQIETMLESKLVYAKPAILQMEQGFISTLPLGLDRLMIGANMNTSPLSTTFPFVSSDLTSNRGILYGINRHNNSLILFDRFSMENANMVIFAKSGAGKSYAVKLEILRSLMFGVDVIVIDPENEYKYICETVGGTFMRISLTSRHHINPFDLPPPIEDENPEEIIRSNIVTISGLVKVMIGKLTAEEDSILDKGITETYAIKDITSDSGFQGKTVPTMQDLVNVLENMEGGTKIATRLKKYTEGSFAGFLNQPTNVKINKNFVVFNIRDMEDELRPIAMYVILHHIWTAIRSKLKKRIMVVDEAWWMMQHEEAAAFLFGIAKRARKYYLGLTTITQDISDFIIKETFYLTDEEKYLLLESNVGEGIFFAGQKRAAIKVVASYSEDQIITSDPEQLLEIEKAKKELMEEEKNKE